MKQEIVQQLYGAFESLVRSADGVEHWHARELQPLLGYLRWENFAKAIERAKTACFNSGQAVEDHFREVTKMVDLGSGSSREVEDIALTRYACYLVAQNGDSSKAPIAFAQTYFAIQTRKQELVERRLADVERLEARDKLSASEKVLSGVIYERLGDDTGFARIRSKGDAALFGGMSTKDMKRKLEVSEARPLADFLPTITIKAKDFANEITTFNVKKEDLRSELSISDEHVKNNTVVRKVLTDRGIHPESLPREEDIKKIGRRVASEQKKLPSKPKPLPRDEGSKDGSQ